MFPGPRTFLKKREWGHWPCPGSGGPAPGGRWGGAFLQEACPKGRGLSQRGRAFREIFPKGRPEMQRSETQGPGLRQKFGAPGSGGQASWEKRDVSRPAPPSAARRSSGPGEGRPGRRILKEAEPVVPPPSGGRNLPGVRRACVGACRAVPGQFRRVRQGACIRRKGQSVPSFQESEGLSPQPGQLFWPLQWQHPPPSGQPIQCLPLFLAL